MQLKPLVFLMFLTVATMGSAASGQSYSATELANWDFRGSARLTVNLTKNTLLLEEVSGSKGAILVSPELFRDDLIVTFTAKPLTPTSVLVLMLNVTSNAQGFSGYNLPRDYDGNMRQLVKHNDSYFFAFNNAAHNSTPYIARYQGGESRKLASAADNIPSADSYTVEAGKLDGKLWLNINGKMVVEALDQSPASGGHIIFRIRGTQTSVAGVRISNFSLTPAK